MRNRWLDLPVHITPFVLVAVAGVFGVGCARSKVGARAPGATAQHRYEFTQPQMGVPFRIVLYAPDQAAAEAASTAAFQRIRELNDLLTDYDTDSELNRLSQTAGQGQAVPLSPELWRVLEQAQVYAQASDGAFDVTVGPVVSLWRKARREKKLPDSARLAEARAAVGHEKLILDPQGRTARLITPFMHLDVGGIAKGYAVDAALAVLRARGFPHALVAGSGDIAVGDPPPGRRGWRIEIAPLDTTNAPPARFVLLANRAIATSGDVFQRVEIGGVRYSHIVDPRTGSGLTDHRLVTVIAPDCTTADVTATVVSVLGPEKGLRFVQRLRGVSARIVRQPGPTVEVYESGGFKRFYEAVPSD